MRALNFLLQYKFGNFHSGFNHYYSNVIMHCCCMSLVTVWSSCITTKCYWEILASLFNHSSGGVDMCHSNYCTLNPQLPTRLLTLTQPPPDFHPPAYFFGPTNGWYHGQVREKQGVFSCLYVQFRYSRKLISNSKLLPTICVPVMQYNQ